MFLQKAIEKILDERDIRRKEHAQLKKACESALEQLKGQNNADDSVSSNGTGVLPTYDQFVNADAYFLPFELACHSKTPRIVAIALDCLQKLIAYGHLVGQTPDASNPERLLVDRIIEAICYPFQGPQTDDAVELQIIKAILAAVLSNTCEVHEKTLLLCVRTCFNIYLTTRKPINSSTAKGTLTQIITSVFNSMYAVDEDRLSLDFMDETDEEAVRSVVDSLINQVAMDIEESDVESLNMTVEDGDATLSFRASTSSSIKHLNVSSLHNDSADPANISDSPDNLQFTGVHQKDAYLLLRALCRLADKPLQDNTDARSHDYQSKLLSLEMILMIVQGSPSNLPSSHCITHCIRHELCTVLSKNAVASEVSVFTRSLAIFVELVEKFKIHLKRQIEVFFKEIIISMLESPSSTIERRLEVLKTVAVICGNSQCLVDIYVNYDCHLTGANIFKDLIECLTKIAMEKHFIDTAHVTPFVKEREREMRLMALNSLVCVLQCLADFYLDITGNKVEVRSATDVGDSSIKDASPKPTSPTVSHFSFLRQKKELIEQGIELFSRRPEEGLKFLQEKSFVATDVVRIAQFFHEEDRLDKTVVGDYLGDGKERNKEIMYAYVDLIDFHEMDFVQALRVFLDKFRLPGEAQKIDRLMEKFASRYCECNPALGLFASADTAYVLAYSIIMLTTDLHSPQVRNKMTKEQYVTMNRGINDQADLPSEYLESIYDEIATNEIKMNPGLNKRLKQNASVINDRQRRQIEQLELVNISETAHALLVAATQQYTQFTSASHVEHVMPMFQIVWTPCLAAFSTGFRDSDDEVIWKSCLGGFRYAIRVACLFRMRLERDAYVQGLASFTNLNMKTSIAEMKSKNVESIKLLLVVGDENGDYLDESWFDVLKCISHLEVAQMLGQHVYAKNLHGYDRTLQETSSQDIVVAVDKIFQGSSKLSAEAIVHFVKAICAISNEELHFLEGPRMFMLQKIVEISEYNMDRIRIQWSLLWNILGEHFNKVGCHAIPEVAEVAVHALRQLSKKFLERGELPNFRFQKDFLRPFEVIMNKNRSLTIRALVIECIQNLVDGHWSKIRSGWKNVFALFTAAASEMDSAIVNAAFKTTRYVVEDVFAKEFSSVLDSFQEAIKCLSEFACNTHLHDLSMDAIHLIKGSATLVAHNIAVFQEHNWEESTVSPSSPVAQPSWNSLSHSHSPGDTSQRVWLRGWLPIFSALSCIIQRSGMDVKTHSLSVMFEIMRTHGERFTVDWWEDLFKVTLRIFDVVKLNDSTKEPERFRTCTLALYPLFGVFTQFFDVLSGSLLESIYTLIFSCIQQEDEELACTAIKNFESLVVMKGSTFDSKTWEATISLILRILRDSSPTALLTWEKDAIPTIPGKPLENGNFNSSELSPSHSKSNGQSDSCFSALMVKCVVQLEMIDTTNSVVFGENAMKLGDKVLNGEADQAHNVAVKGLYPFICREHLLKIVEVMMESHYLARRFNGNNMQRTILWKAGFRGRSKPNLLKQETQTIRCIFGILFALYIASRDGRDEIASKLNRVSDDVITHYLGIRLEQQRLAWRVVIHELLYRTTQLPDDLFEELGVGFGIALVRLIESEEPLDIRRLLRRIMERTLTSYTSASTV
ncbi:hypothetical protein QR680_009262 [Steinernema hermaphroditum]|uniref:SEC7 domain-containing protein n=1 Tax=Steinernema hermaphroditum TaxID=289476 RepID=A0AA39M8J7_9BILA|nr:hypothetical protein QR680_009262 [Steinernema hermaphroditum]